MLIPVSLLSSYLYCPRKVFLQRVLNMREPPKPELTIGTIRHAILERYADVEREVITRIARSSTRDEIETAILEAYEPIIRAQMHAHRDDLYAYALDDEAVYGTAMDSCRDDARFRARLISEFLKTHDVEHEALYETLTPRIISEKRYSNNALGITGIVDRILVYDNEAIPIELKTGRAPKSGMWPGHRIQLSAYLLLVSTEHRVTRGSVRYLDTDTDVDLRNTPFIKHEITRLVEEVRSVLEGTTLPRKVEMRNKCARCGLREACYSESTVTKAMIERFGADAVIR